jgi:uncharacterized protein (DUF2236 family)
LKSQLEDLAEQIRSRITNGAAGPFRHTEYPLAHSLDYPGDPGLHGPESVSWTVMGDVATFIGGIRGLLIQAAHPEVVAGVGDHSRYREDPLGRLSRTSAYVTATSFGAMPEVEQAVSVVRRIHQRVKGVSERGVPYDADDPGFSAWVHNALTDSFLVANQVYGATRLSPAKADQFVREQTKVGALLNADPTPDTASSLSDWIVNHPAIGPSSSMAEAVEFLRRPPLNPGLRAGYKVLQAAAVATIPMRIRHILGVETTPGAIPAGKAAIRGLRWAMGFSPTWHLALIRTNAPVPEGKFRQPLPVAIEDA